MMRALALVLALTATLPVGPTAREAAPSPQAFLGYRLGTERRLPDWERTVAYLHALDRTSSRVAVEQLGRSTEGRPFLLVTVSASDAPQALRTAREAQRRLADPRTTTPDQAGRLVEQGRAVVLMGAGVHSNETGGTQALLELVWHLATDRSAATEHVLRNVVLLVVPSQNPDGQQHMAEWLAANAATPYEDAPMPELYHRYAGHDNNRDAFMQTQIETQLLSRVLYRDWRPEVFHDLHQMGPARARIFVPPYRSPINPNVDPLIWTGTTLLGQAMAARLLEDGKTGVVWGEMYNGYWQGANSTTPWWHNVLGLLTEVASARPASPTLQEAARPAPGSLAPAPARPAGTPQLPPPPDVQFRANYPEPWLGGRWAPRDVIDYHLTAALGLLEGVASNRTTIKRQFHAMHRRTVARFAGGSPWAFVVPRTQHDAGAVGELVRVLEAGGADVERVSASTAEVEEGDVLIRLAQPEGRWIKDLLEPQIYPEGLAAGERPYDLTGWTLGLQLGVTVRRLDRPLALTTSPFTTRTAGEVVGTGDAFLVTRERNASATLVNRLWDRGGAVSWLHEPLTLDGRALGSGTAVIRGVSRREVEREARMTGDRVLAVASAGLPPLATARRPHVALLDPWGGAIDAGWTRWVLEQHGFRYQRVRPPALQRDDALVGFDVVVIPDMTASLLLRGATGGHVRPEHRGGLGEAGVATLKRFVQRGGTVVTLGDSSEFAVDHLDVPVAVAVRTDQPDATFVAGSLLSGVVEVTHPIAAGMPARIAVMNVMNPAFTPARGGEHLRPLVRYQGEPLALSGYVRGAARLTDTLAAFDAPIGRGRVVVLGFRPQHRAQTWATFKLLFGAIFVAGESAPGAEPPTADQ
jgi:hypothetical protein